MRHVCVSVCVYDGLQSALCGEGGAIVEFSLENRRTHQAMAAASELHSTIMGMRRSLFDSQALLDSLQTRVRSQEKLLEARTAGVAELNERLRRTRKQLQTAEGEASSVRQRAAAARSSTASQLLLGKQLASAAAAIRPPASVLTPTVTAQALLTAWNSLLSIAGPSGILE